MFGLGTKIFGTLSVALTFALIISVMQIRYLNKEVETLEDNQETLEQAIVDQKTTIDTQRALTDASVLREGDLEADLDALQQVATGFSNEINSIRATEHEKALLAPYERGAASSNRFESLWLRIENRENNNNIIADVAETDNPSSTNR